jgi:P pilus assembly chaperone PapD
MKSYWSKALIVSLANAAAAMAMSQSMGDLIVSPTRILLDEKTKSTDVMLVNRSTKAIRYRLNIVEMEMSEDGLMKRVQGGSLGSRHSAPVSA